MEELQKLSKQVARLQLENSQLKSTQRSVLRNTGMTFEQAVDELKLFLSSNKESAFNASFEHQPAAKPSKDSVFSKNHSETAVLVLSDWHTGEVVEPLEINGMNKFTPMILANRLSEVTDSFLKILAGHQQMYHIDRIWLPILGDMISGSIHPELIVTNALLDYPSSVLAARLMILVVEKLKTTGLPIRLDMVVGNHARALPKLPTKKQAHLSLDWMAYVMVEEYFRNDKQVETHVHQSQIALVSLRGHRFAIEHGAGYPFNKKESLDVRLRNIFDSKVYRDATGMEGSSVDFVITGDKHRGYFSTNHLINGSLVGSSELTTSWRLSPLKAEQTMMGISDRRPLTFCYPLEVTSNISERPSNVFSRYVKQFMKQHGR